MPQSPEPQDNQGFSALSLANITEPVPPAATQELQQAAQQVQPDVEQGLEAVIAAAVAQAVQPYRQQLQATIKQVQRLQHVPQQLQQLQLQVRDRVDREIARNRNAALCMGPDKDRVPLRWPQHQGKPAPERFDGKWRPSAVKGVMNCNISVIDSILKFYGQPILGSSEVRRKQLLKYLGIYS